MSLRSHRVWARFLIVTFFGAAMGLSPANAASRPKTSSDCERHLNQTLLEHLEGLRFTREGAGFALSPSIPIEIESQIVSELLKISAGGSTDSLQNWLEALPKSERYFDLLDQLPRLSLLTPSLDWLPKILANRKIIPTYELTDLIKWAPVWEKSPYADPVRKMILNRLMQIHFEADSTPQNYGVRIRSASELVIHLIRQAPNSDEKKRLQRWAIRWISSVLKETADLDFTDTSYWFVSLPTIVPYDQLPQRLQRIFEADWLDFSINPVIRLNSKVHYTLEEVHAGSCPAMFEGHACSLLPAILNFNIQEPDSYPGKFILIKVGGRLIGSLKAAVSGDPSFLSFRNVQDENGRLVLLAGGVYRLSNATMTSIRKQLGSAPYRRPGAQVTLDQIGVSPLSFLINEETTDSATNSRRLDDITGYMNPRELRQYLGVREIDAWTVLKRAFKEIVSKKE